MNRAVSVREMREIDRAAIEEYGIPSMVLMENAARGIADLIGEMWKGGETLVICGKGNNGGDGLACARYLYNRSFPVNILLTCDPESLKGDAALQLAIVRKMRLKMICLEEKNRETLRALIKESAFIVDAIFGVGLTRRIKSPYAEWISEINNSGKPVLSIDLPSGLDGDTGEALGAAVRATVTGTLGFMKQGLCRAAASAYAGEIRLVDIGIPRGLLPEPGV